MTTKERHESVGKGQESLVKGLQRAFTTETIADQHDHEINGIVLAKACAGKLHAVLNGFQDASRDQHLSKGGSFCSPGRDRGNGFRVHLDCYGKISHTECVFSLSGNQSITSFPFKETHFFCLPPVSLSSCSVMTSRCASRGKGYSDLTIHSRITYRPDFRVEQCVVLLHKEELCMGNCYYLSIADRIK